VAPRRSTLALAVSEVAILRLPQIVCITILLLSACSPAKDTKAAEQTVAQFRRQMAAASLADIYATAAPEWRKSASRAESDAFLGAVNRKLGAVKTSAQTGWRDNLDSRGHTVILDYHTEFEGGGADETFTVRLNGDNGQLVGYHISSMAMMVK
jgi:hypothetical protein